MIKIPKIPFEVSYLVDDDPFVKEAIRKRGRNEECWCGSGLKYKFCHFIRETANPLSLRHIQAETHRIFWESRECNYIDHSTCSGPIIDAHTIQRKGSLESIINNHHVHRLSSDNEGNIIVKKIGWKKASTFPGFCAKHDSELFGPLENTPFFGTNEQCVLQSYRVTCHEYYKKKALLNTIDFQKLNLDRGKNRDIQIEIQASLSNSYKNALKGIEELEITKSEFESAISSKCYDNYNSIYLKFTGNTCLLSSGISHVEYDFIGNKLFDIYDFSQRAPTLTHGIIPVGSENFIFFCWKKNDILSEASVNSFMSINDKYKADIFAQYCFLQCENTFFCKDWWHSLSRQAMLYIIKLTESLYYEGGKFEPSGYNLLPWVLSK